MTWPTKKLGELEDTGIIELGRGKVISKTDITKHPGNYPVYSAARLNNGEFGRYGRYMFDEELITWSVDGGGNFFYRPRHKYSVTNVCGWIRILRPHILNYKFLYFVLDFAHRRLNFDYIYKAHPSVIRGIYEIPLPPIEEQRRIVEKIEKLFAKIDEASCLRAESSAASAALLPSALHHIFSRAEKENWPTKKLGEIAILNPKKSEINSLSDDTEISFVPMNAVDEDTQTITGAEIKKLASVRMGYTYFRENDVLFAKITPCMENGKVAIARNLKNGIGLGSTEFHVIRATDKILPEWIFVIVGSKSFRDKAEEHMTGTAGQQRVPIEFLKNIKIPLPPLSEQKKIVAHLDVLSAKTRELQNLQAQTAADLSTLRQSILSQVLSH
jgi:type I restriction enzyme S subunit